MKGRRKVVFFLCRKLNNLWIIKENICYQKIENHVILPWKLGILASTKFMFDSRITVDIIEFAFTQTYQKAAESRLGRSDSRLHSPTAKTNRYLLVFAT
jgi:hypothetical protein